MQIWSQDSLLGLLLVGLLALLLVLLVAGLGHLLEVLELVDEEGSHDSISDLGSGEDATVSAGHGPLGDGHSLEVVGSGHLDSLHTGALGVLLEDENHS